MAKNYNKLISLGTLIALTGYITSGPFGLLLVKLTKPQPAWTNALVFSNNYHIIQDVPYYLGFLLIGGMVMTTAGHYLNYYEENNTVRFSLLLSLLLTGIFASLIFFNYICQTTFIRHLALHYDSGNNSIIAAFSMANPMSLSWSVEMWGYGILGVATWLLSGYYRTKKPLIRWLLIGNGMLSIASVLLTVANINWIMTKTGIVAYMIWNAWMIALMLMIYFVHKNSSHR